MSEEITYRYKRLNELDEIFELTHSYGDDYPVIINRELDKIINNEIQLNKLKDRINKAVEYIEELDDETDDTIYDISRDIKMALVALLKEDKE